MDLTTDSVEDILNQLENTRRSEPTDVAVPKAPEASVKILVTGVPGIPEHVGRSEVNESPLLDHHGENRVRFWFSFLQGKNSEFQF